MSKFKAEELKSLDKIAREILKSLPSTSQTHLFLFQPESREGWGWRMNEKGITRLKNSILTRREFNQLHERCRLKETPKVLPNLFLGKNLQKINPKERVLLLPLFQGFILRELPPASLEKEKKILKNHGDLISILLKEFWRRLNAEKKAKGSKELLYVIEAIHSSNDVTELFQMIAEKTSDLFPQVDLVTLTIFKNGGEPLWIRKGPFQGKISSTPSPTEIGITDLLRKKKKPLLFHSAEKLRKALNLSTEEDRFSSTLSIPITTNGNKIGALHLETFSEERAFSQFDLELLHGFANEASLAIDRTRAHDTLKKKANRLEAEAETLEITYAQLMQSEKLASIGELAGSIAHEINNPLMTLMGRIELLLKTLPSTDSNFSSLDIMNREVERISSLVRGLLQFTRRSAADYERESIQSIISECLLLTENYLRNNRVTVERNIGNSLPSILANRNQLVQVFLNLITNSIQSMKQGGNIQIDIYTLHEGTLSNDQWMEILFRDSGEGIPPEYRNRVFEPFVTTKENGTGLGLSVSKRIVEEHGGKIFIDNEYHQGTRVIIQLPIKSDSLKERKEGNNEGKNINRG